MGRGDHVTAISAVLNMTDKPLNFRHRKHPEYDRIMPPGLFRYRRGVTAPIKWEWDSGSLIDVGDFGTMWQDNARDGRHVRYKRGGEPTSVSDGENIYTRRASFPGEQYLVLGVYSNGQVKVQQSTTALESIWRNLSEDVLNILNIVKPEDYTNFAQNPRAAETFARTLSNNAVKYPEEMKNLKREHLDKLFSVGQERLMEEFEKLSTEERELIAAGEANEPAIQAAKKILAAIGLDNSPDASAIVAISSLSVLTTQGEKAVVLPIIAIIGFLLLAVITIGAAVIGIVNLVALIVGLVEQKAVGESP